MPTRASGPTCVSLHPRSDYRLSCFPQTRRGRRGQGRGPGADSAASRSAARLAKLRAPLGAAAAGERCGGRMKAPPCSGGPGRLGREPSGSRGPGKGSLGRRARADSPVRRQRGRRRERRAGGESAGVAGRRRAGCGACALSPGCCCCCSPRSPWTGFIAPGSGRRCRAAGVSPHVGSRPSPAPCASPPRVQSRCPAPDPGEPCLSPGPALRRGGCPELEGSGRARGVARGPAGNRPSSRPPAVSPGSWVLGGKGWETPDPKLERRPPVRVASGAVPPWARLPSTVSATGGRGGGSPGEKGRHRCGSTPLGRNGDRLRGSSPGQSPELRSGEGDHVWSQRQSCLRDASDSGSGPRPLRPRWGGVAEAEASPRQREGALTPAGHLWSPLGSYRPAPGAFSRPCGPLPKAPSPISGLVWVPAQETRTQILNCTVMLQTSF